MGAERGCAHIGVAVKNGVVIDVQLPGANPRTDESVEDFITVEP